MKVIDASVAVKWVLPEPDSGLAVALRGTDALIAPSLVIAEVGNALWKSVLRGQIDNSDALTALQLAMAHFDRIVSSSDFSCRQPNLAIWGG